MSSTKGCWCATKVWIKWITLCISQKCCKYAIWGKGWLSTENAFYTVDKVDNSETHRGFCTFCRKWCRRKKTLDEMAVVALPAHVRIGTGKDRIYVNFL